MHSVRHGLELLAQRGHYRPTLGKIFIIQMKTLPNGSVPPPRQITDLVRHKLRIGHDLHAIIITPHPCSIPPNPFHDALLEPRHLDLIPRDEGPRHEEEQPADPVRRQILDRETRRDPKNRRQANNRLDAHTRFNP